ncbi:MAG: 16S rRNA (uracil(1498)-N(3))-methyltransferase [Bdellovibrionales bacterium]
MASSLFPSSQRLFVEADLEIGASVAVSAEQAHYLLHVLRMKPGEEIRLFNGHDGEWKASLGMETKKGLMIAVEKHLREQKEEPDLWLCCAPIKKAHFDYMIEKATELGVAAIKPVLTSRAQIREVNAQRCRGIAIEAAEQSERLNVPVIRETMNLESFVAQWRENMATSDRRLIVCAEWGEATPVQTALKELAKPRKGLPSNPPSAAIVTGPEGGFAAEELALLGAIPNVVFVRLGPRILRADTAALAALACWQAQCGDWLNAPA